ncbi:uncharacterized protein LOC111318523 [Durio zibethinus]|uniref:Uncharacterized protein LOC111318523 n=1 Tax=Durio zibethinus TaxID=66656 RepID=A0A6P6BJ80_DURZI|nr:uncharacterized protein LOC111318523 [Durio zibethinus]
MADTDSYIKQQQLVKEHNQANPSKYYTHILYKAIIVIIFLVIIPVFPTQAPEFINQTLLNGSWELLHLLFVGIAVSYGLFSRRNDETEKEINNNQSKFDNVQSFVSRFLQVSSVFDDEVENLSGSDESKVRTWSSRYYRNEPPVVVAKEQAVLDERGSSSTRIAEKPLLLPVRSLKSRVLDANSLETIKENSENARSLSRSNSSLSSKRFSNKGTNGELGRLDQETLVKLNENNIVLPSPIPWRSRSGRLEVKEDIESEFNRLESRSFRSQTTVLSRSSSMSSSPKLSHSPPLSSPKKLSPSSLSTEAQAKSAEDLVRKKSIYRSPPPPPPPPPPPAMIHKSSSLKPISTLTDDEVSFDEDLPWNFASKPNDLNGSRGDAFMGKQGNYGNGLPKGKSGRMIRPGDSLSGTRKDGETENGINGKGGRFDQTSLRTERLNRESVSFMPKPTFMEFPQEEKQEFVEKLVVETTDNDSESDEEEIGETSFVSSNERSSNNEEASPSSGIDGGSDVDKKADEFIAKVREQIRLQRIDCIKRSSGQMKRNSTRSWYTEILLVLLLCNLQLQWRIISTLHLVGYCIPALLLSAAQPADDHRTYSISSPKSSMEIYHDTHFMLIFERQFVFNYKCHPWLSCRP